MQKPVAHSDLISQKRIVKISFFIDLLIVIPVIIIAVLSNSLVLDSDVFGYFFTLSASSISLIVLNKCIRNERGKYDFGMGKLESLSALVTSTFMILMLFLLAYLSVIRIVDTVELNVKYVLAGIFIQALGFVINIYIWVQSKKLSRKGASPIMEAQWRVNRANAYSNVFVILSLSLALIFNNSN
jgi:divalent metal cation (Fe/Co/Zn/Cd) transporter